MDEQVRSVLIGTSGLSLLALIGLVLAFVRDPSSSSADERKSLAALFLCGIAFQVAHMLEELLTGFPIRFPELLGLPAWSDTFFVVFNVCWIAVWVLSAAALLGPAGGPRVAWFPVWFFALGMTLNGIAHPLAAVVEGVYFPGLWTSPGTLVFGVLLLRRLVRATAAH